SRVEVLNILGAGLFSQYEVRESEAAIDRAIHDAGALPGGHPMALQARLLKEWIRLYRGRAAEVRSEIDQLLREMRRSPATLPEDLAGAHRVLSWSALEAGDYAVAESAAQEALRIVKTRLDLRQCRDPAQLVSLARFCNQSVLALIDLCYAQLAS